MSENEAQNSHLSGKPDRLSALIARFHVQARVISFVPKLMMLNPQLKSAVSPLVNSQISPGAETNGYLVKDTGGDDDNHREANLFIARSGQLEEKIKRQIRSSNSDLKKLEDDVPLLVFYPRGVSLSKNDKAPSCDNGLNKDQKKGTYNKNIDKYTQKDAEKEINQKDYNENNSESDINKSALDTSFSGGYVCAVVDTGGVANPIALALPDLVVVRLDRSKALEAVTNILLEEAHAPRCGGQAVIDRLCEIVVIRLLRHLIEAGDAEVGLLAGLAHPNLSLAIVAIHDNPARSFSLEELAEISAMSRTHFANSFRKSVGVTPGQYLSNWRLTLARMEISKGIPLKTIARRVGFSSPAALSRAFSRHYGVSPRVEMAQR
ncbi:helix-turn-helix transcriptional regulator [Kiloniella antarctica]|uniref:AraC family transcriptional regulator n=1 Tax=Kiloniella antarctica TaxID=1550907 RepID=A0ABW5BLW8_9PROT